MLSASRLRSTTGQTYPKVAKIGRVDSLAALAHLCVPGVNEEWPLGLRVFWFLPWGLIRFFYFPILLQVLFRKLLLIIHPQIVS